MLACASMGLHEAPQTSARRLGRIGDSTRPRMRWDVPTSEPAAAARARVAERSTVRSRLRRPEKGNLLFGDCGPQRDGVGGCALGRCAVGFGFRGFRFCVACVCLCARSCVPSSGSIGGSVTAPSSSRRCACSCRPGRASAGSTTSLRKQTNKQKRDNPSPEMSDAGIMLCGAGGARSEPPRQLSPAQRGPSPGGRRGLFFQRAFVCCLGLSCARAGSAWSAVERRNSPAGCAALCSFVCLLADRSNGRTCARLRSS